MKKKEGGSTIRKAPFLSRSFKKLFPRWGKEQVLHRDVVGGKEEKKVEEQERGRRKRLRLILKKKETGYPSREERKQDRLAQGEEDEIE